MDLKIPRHLGIILDGNRRWARLKHLPENMGHAYGAVALKNIVTDSFNLGIYALSLYCFSTENFKRSEDEVNYIFSLANKYIEENIESLMRNNIRLIFSGDLNALPEKTRKLCEFAANKSKDNTKNVLNICINYGSKQEIIRACKMISNDVLLGNIKEDQINSKLFESYLYTKDIGPIDLLIRTSNERRLSNFMLYQLDYAELYFTKTFWPAFTKRDLIKALKDYTLRDRRFGL